jgi:acylphosphatase
LAATEAPVEVSAGDLEPLTAQPWQWAGFSGAEEQLIVETPESYQVTFNADGTVNIVADCPPESRSEQFVELLSSAAGYFMVDDQLYINLMDDAGIMRLGPTGETAASPDADAAPAAEAAQLQAMMAGVRANPWKWTAFSSPTEEVTVEAPANYMVTFKHDGTVEIKADCNSAVGT